MKILASKQKKQQQRPTFLRKVSAILALSVLLALPVSAIYSSAQSGSLVSQASAAPDDKKKEEPAPTLPEMKIDTTCPKGQCLINKYVNPTIKVVSALVGVGVTTSIIYAGIQYASSSDNPQKVAAARQRITTSVFVLLGYFVFYAFLKWLVPAGSGL